ncbi:hypothetical protein K7G98_14975 [Saccharothrix sp. MB29]|nr:hypothetical protein [Saccharothrix sp. MB29]
MIARGAFNDPAGAPAAQNAISAQLAGLVDRVPAGGEVLGSVMDSNRPDTANTAATTRLRAALGSDDTAGSYVVHCEDKFPGGPDRGASPPGPRSGPPARCTPTTTTRSPRPPACGWTTARACGPRAATGTTAPASTSACTRSTC